MPGHGSASNSAAIPRLDAGTSNRSEPAFRNEGVPSVPRLGFDVRKASAGWRAGDANEMVAARTLNLPPPVAWVAPQGLIAVGTIELEFSVAHSLSLNA